MKNSTCSWFCWSGSHILIVEICLASLTIETNHMSIMYVTVATLNSDLNTTAHMTLMIHVCAEIYTTDLNIYNHELNH